MQTTKFYKKQENKILALAAVLVMGIFVGLNFDYFYQANDDVYIKNLLSGVYTGTPESHNIQMHYPISLCLSLLYRIAGNLPVYGLFLCVCHYGCCYFLFERSLHFTKNSATKILLVATETLLATALLLPELVFTQYTVTCAMLAGTALFRFYTTGLVSEVEGVKPFIKKNISNILLVILAFCIRSEMFLLVLPFVCVAGFFKWMQEKPVFTKENAAKYLGVFGLILAGLGLAQGIHMIAYSGAEWKTFTQFFDDRTELYDYQFIPEYEQNREFYESIGLDQSEQELLVNYNFGLDEDIDSEVLRQTAEYAKTLKTTDVSFMERFKISFADYRYKTFHATDYPWNLAVLAGYALLFLLAWKNKSYAYLWKLPLLAVVRTGLWMYIMMGNRYPDRITHSLYFVELLLLAAMLFEQCKKEQDKGQGWQRYSFTVLTGIIFVMIGISALPASMDKVQAESEQREAANEEIKALDAYCRKNVENFYFVDVYSAVSDKSAVEYSEKVFENVDNSPANYDLMGGWVSKSPADYKKLEYFGLESLANAILDSDKAYVIIKKEKSMDWIVNYYEKKRGIVVEAVIQDTIATESEEVYTVYKIAGKE